MDHVRIPSACSPRRRSGPRGSCILNRIARHCRRQQQHARSQPPVVHKSILLPVRRCILFRPKSPPSTCMSPPLSLGRHLPPPLVTAQVK
ncbi:hypothetical protein CKAH01_02118 [Colletotrichum kahawae]|uniref:Uncharacterized protein n=1 Tax=Colletotrichum kahawae TaxID=34407 RepID=A0AAD9Y256_COLKA|nr:hypothetical protein CKAH01_02118 [Colletotrichum kahawae]